MKKIITLLTVITFIFGCSNDNNSSSNIYKWSCKINGVQYSWEGPVFNGTGTNDGQSVYTLGTGVNPLAGIVLSSPTISGFQTLNITVSLPNSNSGQFIMNQNTLNNSSGITMIFSTSPTSNEVYILSNNAQMTVNIQSISPNSIVNSGLSGAGKVIGVFSGTLYSLTNRTLVNVTEGSFEAIRAQ